MQKCVLKLCGAVAILCVARRVDGAPHESGAPSSSSSSSAAVTATVEELPQRPMTLQNGYHPGLFPFNKGEPFVVDPNMSGIDFNTKPPNSQQRSDEYYDYDTSKLEEVPYDYKGDPIDRKDVVEPNAPRPNDIKPNGSKTKQTDIYHFLNLPVKYSSSDKFPLMSSSYANTKIQGSGTSSSSSPLSNHKMPPAQQQQSVTSAPAAPTTSWYNAPKTSSTSTTVRPTTTTTTTTTARPMTTSTTPSPPSQEYEEESVYDYDYYHPQEPAASTSTTTTSSTTTTTTAAPTTAVHHHQNPSTTAVTYRPTASTTTSFVDSETTHHNNNYNPYANNNNNSSAAAVLNKTTNAPPAAATTARPEIDSKLDGTSFADYDAIKPADGEPHRSPAQQQQHFKPMPGTYQFADDKTYPLITSGKVPMTFTAHVSSGISLNSNQKEQLHHQQQQQQQQQHASEHVVKPAAPAPPSSVVSEPTYALNRPSQQLEVQDSDGGHRDTIVHDGTRISTSGSRPPPPSLDTAINRHPPLPSTYTKLKPPPQRPSENDQSDTAVYYKVRPDTQQFPGAVVANRPASQPVQGRPYPQQTEPLAVKTSHAGSSDAARKPPVNGEQPLTTPAQVRPQQPYPMVPSDVYVKNKPSPQYAAPQIQPDTSKFKPPKHVINHFIKTQPNEDNKSYALQTSFSIGMDGERTATETRPQGIGQVLMVEESSSAESTVVNQTMIPVVKPKATTSVPFVQQPPPQQRPVQKPQPQYPRPQWENIPKPPTYYPPPKRDGAPPQRPNLPNILPQFRPNAKVDAAPLPPPMMTPQSHSAATIERVQIPMDHLRPPPLPKPQFLKVDRNDDNMDEEILAAVPEKETRILQQPDRRPQPAKVTTLQMIQHGAPTKMRDDGNKENPVHVIYAANAPPRPSEKIVDDSVILDVKDRSDVPILKTKTAVNKPVKTDFPYQIVKPDDNQNISLMEYKAYSPTKPDTIKPNDQELVPNLQDYVPVATRDSASNIVMPQKPITATLKTSEDNHKIPEEGGHKPQLQNFQIPFQPSLKLPENSNGWSVVRKAQIDSASEKIDETGDAVASTEKFDPDNFKPQLVGGFMPINPLTEEAKEKGVEQSERAK